MNDPENIQEHIGVLMGGISSEREISFKSGRAIVAALEKVPCAVSGIEINTEDEKQIMGLLKEEGVDVAFVALHGKFGEDGGIQEILERGGIPFTGSGAGASRMAMNKALTQKMLKENRLPVPAYGAVSQERMEEKEEIIGKVGGLPVVVKPACEGSSIGITIVHEISQWQKALDAAFHYGGEVLIERYIQGKELTCGILGQEALPVVEIRPRHPFFDFEAKYQKGMSEYIVPAQISSKATQQVQEIAREVFRVMGCADFARVDFILDEEGHPYVLEINTIPGFTQTSLLPMAAQEAGMNFTQLCLRILQMALRRKGHVVTGKNSI